MYPRGDTHSHRVHINAKVNRQLAPTDAVLFKRPEGKLEHSNANKPQDMLLWPDIVLMAIVSSSDKQLKNGIRYKVLEIEEEEEVSVMRLDKDDEPEGEAFRMKRAEVAQRLRLTHAITYHNSQARTIRGPLRLVQTSRKSFTRCLLITGLGRAPEGKDVQVE